jgi:hypothetical protein
MSELSCRDERRRSLVREKGLNGLDFVEVGDPPVTLTVYFLEKAPPEVTTGNVRIDGGRRVRGIRVIDVTMCRVDDPDLDDCMLVTLDRFGDFSPYRLRLVEPAEDGFSGDRPMAGIDPRYSSIGFSFMVDCPSSLDCLPAGDCTPAPQTEPSMDYLAKDYASFRRLILDRLALLMPGWRETHVPDVGIALAELLAYAGDYLSYYQDAVATEAYLDTARQRISVRRHARLVDYHLHEGCNARAWVCVETDTDVTLPADVTFSTRGQPAEVFAPVEPLDRPLYVAHNRIHFYTWGDAECCIPRGATCATLVDACVECPPAAASPPAADHRLHLNPGDVLIFEEVLGPLTGAPADADRTRRHAVRLTQVRRDSDPVTGTAIVWIEWAGADAMPFSLCISSVTSPPECAPLDNVSVARGNVLLVDHGSWIRLESLGAVPEAARQAPCADAACGQSTIYTAGPFRPQLAESPLTFRAPLPPGAPATQVMAAPDPRLASPQIELSAIPLAPGAAAALFTAADMSAPDELASRLRQPSDPVLRALRDRLSAQTQQLLDELAEGGSPSSGLRARLLEDLLGLLVAWAPQPDLLASGPADRDFVVEVDNESAAHLRFGDDQTGQRPAANTPFSADYRVGNGTAGNVGPDTIVRLHFGRTVLHGVMLQPRNPLPASGGTAPEPIDDAKLRAPTAFRQELVRAVTADDYARLAERHPAVQRAAATLRFTGASTEVQVAIDAVGTDDVDAALLDEVRQLLEPYRRIGHDVLVVPASYVPLLIALTVCVLPGYLRGHVTAVVRAVLGSGRGPDGRPGFFHPDSLTFGDDIYVSRLVATVQPLPGVENVEVTILQRFDGTADNELEEGVLRLGPAEIGRLDGDPDFPENGRLELTIEGGR